MIGSRMISLVIGQRSSSGGQRLRRFTTAPVVISSCFAPVMCRRMSSASSRKQSINANNCWRCASDSAAVFANKLSPPHALLLSPTPKLLQSVLSSSCSRTFPSMERLRNSASCICIPLVHNQLMTSSTVQKRAGVATYTRIIAEYYSTVFSTSIIAALSVRCALPTAPLNSVSSTVSPGLIRRQIANVLSLEPVA